MMLARVLVVTSSGHARGPALSLSRELFHIAELGLGVDGNELVISGPTIKPYF